MFRVVAVIHQFVLLQSSAAPHIQPCLSTYVQQSVQREKVASSFPFRPCPLSASPSFLVSGSERHNKTCLQASHSVKNKPAPCPIFTSKKEHAVDLLQHHSAFYPTRQIFTLADLRIPPTTLCLHSAARWFEEASKKKVTCAHPFLF